MGSDSPIVFYDIASAPPLRTFAPNPWKTRFALNFKGVPYRTEWVHMPNIANVREQLKIPANRTLPDGSPYHTLPAIHDTATQSFVGDSFEIALYLDQAYPDAPKLFHPLTTGLIAAFNNFVDNLFTKHIALCSQLPFDPSVQETVNNMFAKRFGVNSLEDMQLSSEQRESLFASFEVALGELAKAYYHTGGTTDHLIWRSTDNAHRQKPPSNRQEGGVFLDGNSPSYADFIVGAWLKNLEASMKPEDWERVNSWQAGRWAKLVAALDRWTEMK